MSTNSEEDKEINIEEERESEEGESEERDSEEGESEEGESEKGQKKQEKKKKAQTIHLQLSDVIRFDAPSNSTLDKETFLIDYIDNEELHLVNVEDLTKKILKIHEDGILGDGSIESIALLDRSNEMGYARQNNLLPKTWVNIYFGGDTPVIITGEITNLEEDMIEINTFPDNDVLYINFGYKGVPLDLPIENIEIRAAPEKEKEGEEKEGEEKEGEEREEGLRE